MDFRSYFDIPSNITYLNTPGNGLIPKSHYSWRVNRDKEFFDPQGDLRDQQPAFINSVKENFSRLFNCSLSRLFLVPNFSFGYNTLLEGLGKNLKILLLEEDYPSLNYPVISRGFDYNLLPASAKIEEEVYKYIQANQPDVLVLSVVNYISGLKIDLEFVKKLKQDFPSLLIIGDATQFLGTEPFDFENSGFDALGGSGYKWMMAGFGNGYMMISERLADILYADAQRKNKPLEAMWAHKSILNIYFEPGHQDTLSQGTLNQSLLFLEQNGLQYIKSYLDELLYYAYRIFEERNWLLPIIAQREVRSALVNLQINPDYYPFLLNNGIKCFPRGTGIRIGIHFYNTKEDINRFVEVVDSCKK